MIADKAQFLDRLAEFYVPIINSEAVNEFDDHPLFMRRTKVRCAIAMRILGTFPGRPEADRLALCMNGAALRFAAAADEK